MTNTTKSITNRLLETSNHVTNGAAPTAPSAGALDALIHDRLHGLVESVTAEIVSAVRTAVHNDMADRLRLILGIDEKIAAQSTASAAQVAPTKRAPRPTGFPKMCLVEGCNKVNSGPRFSFLCEGHRDVSKAERKKYLDAWKAGKAGKAGRAEAAPKRRRRKARG